MINNLINWVSTLIRFFPRLGIRGYFWLRDKYEKDHGERLPLKAFLGDYPAWRRSQLHEDSPVKRRVIWVVYPAKRYLDSLQLEGKKVFEYGMGGSTLYFLDRQCETTSIEDNKEWYDKLRAEIGENPRWNGHCVPPRVWNIGEPRDERFTSGFPKCEDNCYENYVRMLDRFPDKYFDIIMVDGRARAGCLSLAQSKLADDGMIILDNAERERYAPAQNDLQKAGWQRMRFVGAGPWVDFEFYDTNIWTPPMSRSGLQIRPSI